MHPLSSLYGNCVHYVSAEPAVRRQFVSLSVGTLVHLNIVPGGARGGSGPPPCKSEAGDRATRSARRVFLLLKLTGLD